MGCGTVARQVHLRLLHRLPRAEVVALADTDTARLKDAQRLVPEARCFTDYRGLLSSAAVEAVLVCLPSALHAEAAVAAFEAGKHVYLEKPLATCLVEAREVITAWRRAGVVGMVGFNYRFNPLYQSLKAAVQQGRIGAPACVRSSFSTTPAFVPAWKRSREQGGGVLLDLASHHIDLMRYLLEDEVQAVQACLFSRQTEQDTAVVEMHLDSGLPVQSFFSLSAVEEDQVEVIGDAGKLVVDRYHDLAVRHTEPEAATACIGQVKHGLRTLKRLPYLLQKRRAPWNEVSFEKALSRFMDAVQRGQTVAPTFEDGYRSLAVIEAAEQSAQAKQWVTVPPGMASGPHGDEAAP